MTSRSRTARMKDGVACESHEPATLLVSLLARAQLDGSSRVQLGVCEPAGERSTACLSGAGLGHDRSGPARVRTTGLLG
jgi:hypothetical protein